MTDTYYLLQRQKCMWLITLSVSICPSHAFLCSRSGKDDDHSQEPRHVRVCAAYKWACLHESTGGKLQISMAVIKGREAPWAVVTQSIWRLGLHSAGKASTWEDRPVSSVQTAEMCLLRGGPDAHQAGHVVGTSPIIFKTGILSIKPFRVWNTIKTDLCAVTTPKSHTQDAKWVTDRDLAVLRPRACQMWLSESPLGKKYIVFNYKLYLFISL